MELPGSTLDCDTPVLSDSTLDMSVILSGSPFVFADSPFDFDTSDKLKIDIIARVCSPGPRNSSKKQMIWSKESRAEMVLVQIDQDRCDSAARSKLSYPIIR